MSNLTVSSSVDAFMQSADQAAMQAALGAPASQTVNTHTGSYALQLSDAGNIVFMSVNGYITVPEDGTVAFPVGTFVDIVFSSSGGGVYPATFVTLNWAGLSPGYLNLPAQSTAFRLIKVASDVWYSTSLSVTPALSSVLTSSSITPIADGTLPVSSSLGGSITFQSGIVTAFSSAS